MNVDVFRTGLVSITSSLVRIGSFPAEILIIQFLWREIEIRRNATDTPLDDESPFSLGIIINVFRLMQVKAEETEKTTSDVTSTEELSNGNWLCQIHSYLEFTPKPGEKISCRVEHASLMEPKLYDWGKRACRTKLNLYVIRLKKYIALFTQIHS
uniref:Immunoglobulin C1-set domain-containing protein n=1 Tax=Amphiprion percula TaxID=161767 RepID=A0A3P8RSI3_AMPPE